MSEAGSEKKPRIAIVGATGLIGRQLVALLAARDDVEMHAWARSVVLKHQDMHSICPPKDWPKAIADWKPDILVSALGTTWKQAGKNKGHFRAVDHDLVVLSAEAAQKSGARQAIIISSVGADAKAGNFYLRTKGEMENSVADMGFDRLDIIRPGLLRGERDGPPRMGEQFGIMLSPIVDRLLPSAWSRYRSIDSADVARAIVQLTLAGRCGKHENNAQTYYNVALQQLSAELVQKTG